MLISVEGCVGAGKTTVAKLISETRGSVALLEDFGNNPFLKDFYEDPVANATETEFAFLLQHYHQLKQQAQNVKACEVVSDFHLGKDLIYADLNLACAGTIRVFNELYEELAKEVAAPDLMICLSATPELVKERIRRRDRGFELKIDSEYFGKINAAYESFFQSYEGSKISVSMDEWDFVKDPNLVSKISVLIDEHLKNL